MNLLYKKAKVSVSLVHAPGNRTPHKNRWNNYLISRLFIYAKKYSHNVHIKIDFLMGSLRSAEGIKKEFTLTCKEKNLNGNLLIIT